MKVFIRTGWYHITPLDYSLRIKPGALSRICAISEKKRNIFTTFYSGLRIDTSIFLNIIGI